MAYPYDAPFVAGSETSEEAAKSIKPSSLRSKVASMLRLRGLFGSTDDELEVSLGLRHQTVSARRRELGLLGKAKDSGVKRVTRSGRKATVWIACEQAPQEPHKAIQPCPLCGGSGKVREPYTGKAEQPSLFDWSGGEDGRTP